MHKTLLFDSGVLTKRTASPASLRTGNFSLNSPFSLCKPDDLFKIECYQKNIPMCSESLLLRTFSRVSHHFLSARHTRLLSPGAHGNSSLTEKMVPKRTVSGTKSLRDLQAGACHPGKIFRPAPFVTGFLHRQRFPQTGDTGNPGRIRPGMCAYMN